jgi:DinB superfamily
MWNKPTLIEHLNAAVADCRTAADSVDGTRFFDNSAGKWSIAENLIHLSKSAKAVHKGLVNGPTALLTFFGTASAPSQDYEAIIVRYQAALTGGLIAPSSFVAQSSPDDTRTSVLDRYDFEHKTLVESLQAYSEEELDQVQLPHPALGNMTVREMIYFMVYHIGHHQKAIERLVGG